MATERKTIFKIPYVGIDHYQGLALLYGEKGDFSVIFHLTNPVLQHGADPQAYTTYQNLLLNAVKILGAGHILQKQDVFVRKKYEGKPSGEFLQDKYHAHFTGREYTQINTYLVITRQVRKGSFYTYDRKMLSDFSQHIAKLSDLFCGAGLGPRLMGVG